MYTNNNIEAFATKIRELTAKNICENYQDNLDEYMTVSEIIGLLQKNSSNQYVIDRDVIISLQTEIKKRIYEVCLAKLAAKDIIDCAWDETENEMVFWTK